MSGETKWLRELVATPTNWAFVRDADDGRNERLVDFAREELDAIERYMQPALPAPPSADENVTLAEDPGWSADVPWWSIPLSMFIGLAIAFFTWRASSAQSVYAHPTSELGWQPVAIHGEGFELSDGTVVHAHRLRDIDRAYARALAADGELEALLVEDYPCGGVEALAVRAKR